MRFVALLLCCFVALLLCFLFLVVDVGGNWSGKKVRFVLAGVAFLDHSALFLCCFVPRVSVPGRFFSFVSRGSLGPFWE